MNVRDRISKLETLLQRIQRRARGGTAVAHTPASASAPAASVAPVSAPESLAPSSTDEVAATNEFEHRPVLESFTAEAPTGTLEFVDSEPPEALSEEDVLEMSSDVLESVPPSGLVEPVEPAAPEMIASSPPAATVLNGYAVEEPQTPAAAEEEEAPASSKRHRIASTTIDDAVAAAEREPVVLEEGREVPIKTPPPESGPQEAPLPPGSLAAPPAPDLDNLLDDLPPISQETSQGPSPEQLGETIELEESAGPELELDASGSYAPTPATVVEELEVTLPLGKYAGSYDEALAPPPEAQRELDEHRRRSGELRMPSEPELVFGEAAISESLDAGAGNEAEVELGAPAGASPDVEPSRVIQRSAVSGVSVVELTGVSAIAKTPATFLELLDQSVKLGGE